MHPYRTQPRAPVSTRHPDALLRFTVPLLERLEILWTLLLDNALLIAGSIAVRHYALRFIHWIAAEDSRTWAIETIEIIADWGSVGTVIVIVSFDLLKRLRRALRELQQTREAS